MPEENSWATLVSILLPAPILERLIKSSKEKQISSPESFDKTHHPWGPMDVLVGSLRNREQLRICLQNRFYHVPFAVTGEIHSDIHYIAIYQSKHLFGPDAGILYYGEVEQCRIVNRCEITEIPSLSKEFYYRFSIREWKKLPRKIVAKEFRSNVLFTNCFLLHNSIEVPQLCLQTMEDFSLYRFLLNFKKKSKIDYRNGLVFLQSNRGYLSVSGKVIYSFSKNEFSKTPTYVLRQIKKNLDLFQANTKNIPENV